ncbi:hypothetical protein DFJ69_5954 [Thermomonospora umbrina]|uniref:Uncharacterized protein n=1 Tax=Thermomonospora umbrina TaxID=111806 RepID=A0A3D9SX46_9ACTN|nr:hypothetical protein DFJ69_5954 [Thermomonospora umbrina]
MEGTSGPTIHLAEFGGEPVETASMTLMPHITDGRRPSAPIEDVVVTYATVDMESPPDSSSGRTDTTCVKAQPLSRKAHADQVRTRSSGSSARGESA